jgi:hypothetical protein
MVALSGLPVAGVLCAHRCVAAEHAADASNGDAQCHESETHGLAIVRGELPDGCDPFGAADTITRERSSAPFKDAPMMAAALPLRDLSLADNASRSRARSSAPPRVGLPPGSHLPLRI